MYILLFIFGLIIGSFLNVCIYRIPRSKRYWEMNKVPADEQISFLKPKFSICRDCKKRLKIINLIPVLSFIFQKGKCQNCKSKISLRYPFVELLTACLTIYFINPDYNLITNIIILLFVYFLITISLIDIDYKIIPDPLNIPFILITILISICSQFGLELDPILTSGFKLSLFGFLIGGAMLYIISIIYEKLRGREGLGFGDIKLLAGIGILFGPLNVYLTILIGSVLGTIAAIPLLILKKRGFNSELPFGPYLAIGCLIVIKLKLGGLWIS